MNDNKNKLNTKDLNPREDFHGQIAMNYNKMQEKTTDILNTQVFLGRNMSSNEFSCIRSYQQKSEDSFNEAFEYEHKLMDKQDDNGKGTVDPEADKKVIDSDSATIEKQSSYIKQMDSILRNSNVRPLEDSQSKNLVSNYNLSLQELEQLKSERKILIEKREWQIQGTIEENKLEEQERLKETKFLEETRKRKGDELQEQDNDQKTKKIKDSLIDTYADVSQEPVDYTAGDD